jgi:porphobilinogen synthase
LNSLDCKLDDFIFPIFVYEGENAYKQSLASGYMNQSKVYYKNLTDLLERLHLLGVTQILLFGVPKTRNRNGSKSSFKQGVIQSSIRRVKENFGNNFLVLSDVCLCQYNTSGHCGIISDSYSNNQAKKNSLEIEIDNDKTLYYLGKVSLSLCESGTDFVAPSAMMDGQVLYLRKLLNNHGFRHVKILSYSAKHNSCLYSPFRNNNYLKPGFIEKSSYQSSIYNERESLREILLDIKEGSDWIMIKPSLWYMDIIRRVKAIVNVPVVVQNVSGEYAMMSNILNLMRGKNFPKTSDDARNGAISEDLTHRLDFKLNSGSISVKQKQKQKQNLTLSISSKESKITDDYAEVCNFLTSLKRAGADKIITYFLLDLLDEKSDQVKFKM